MTFWPHQDSSYRDFQIWCGGHGRAFTREHWKQLIDWIIENMTMVWGSLAGQNWQAELMKLLLISMK
jgi:hypothetical protein